MLGQVKRDTYESAVRRIIAVSVRIHFPIGKNCVSNSYNYYKYTKESENALKSGKRSFDFAQDDDIIVVFNGSSC